VRNPETGLGYWISAGANHPWFSLTVIMSRILIIAGLVLIALGLLWPWLTKLGLGRLPGDIAIEHENFRFYFPITTSIIISLVVSLLFWWFRK
jgi:hypothetical protein